MFKLKIVKLVNYLQSSLWFLPLMIVIFFLALSLFTIQADIHYKEQLLKLIPYFLETNTEGAQGILSGISSSMITIAGVVFSITIVALSLTSSQYSSRVLHNFMRDHKTQLVLGIFVGNFSYSLVILLMMKKDFIPGFSVLIAVLLSFIGVGIFVYFIHHIAISIQASRIVETILIETNKTIDSAFTEKYNGHETKEKEDLLRLKDKKNLHPIPSLSTGYIQKTDVIGLFKLAVKYNFFMRIDLHTGKFAIESMPIAYINSTNIPDDSLVKEINKLFTIDRHRTIEQDVSYGIRQLVDVSLKALSPAINDTTTAKMCVDNLTAILVRIADRNINKRIFKEGNKIRLALNDPDFDYFVNEAYNQIRENCRGNITIINRLAWSIKTVMQRIKSSDREQILLKQLEQLSETVKLTFPESSDKIALIKTCSIRANEEY